MRKSLFPVFLAAVCASAAHAATDPALDKVLRQMDEGAAKFQSAEADLKDDFYERVVRDTSTQTGTVYFLRTPKGTQMGSVIGKKIIQFQNGNGVLYDPSSAKRFTPFSAGADKARAESFLTLGFGGSGKDLEKAWDIKLLGQEQMSDGDTNVTVAKLDLVPKDPGVRSTFTHVTIWVDPVRDLSLKQESTTPEGDKRTETYTHIRYNGKLDLAKYAVPKK